MKTKIVITLCFALSLCVVISAEGELEVKRGLFPYMAFIYYPDETVVDGTGARFLRGAVLIRDNWLVTSAVGPSILTGGPLGFPRKTLLARAGAITIDANFTLNEDEDEQEREVIHIVRPYNHSATQWWHTDISLMKTLLPFNLTSAVSFTTLSSKVEYVEKTCTILVYAKKDGNWTEERNLMQLTVELLPSSVANCGHHFVGKTMSCAADSDENKNAVYDPNFCNGNSGGPLICEGNVIGLQTYIDNDCKQPHLYQMLVAWEDFISCGTEDKCHEEQCSKICDVADKDPSQPDGGTTAAPIIEKSVAVEETSIEDVQLLTRTSPEDITASEPPTVELTTAEQTTEQQTTLQPTPAEQPVTESTTFFDSITVTEEKMETKSWPHEKYSDAARKAMEQGDLDDIGRKTKVEAQQEDVKVKVNSVGQTNVLNHSFFFGYFILACLI